jgi:hypothetical protein
MQPRFAALVAIAAACFVESAARANGRYPAANQLVLAPGDPRVLVLRTTFGILVSHDEGAHWDWVCEDAVGYGEAGTGDEDPAIAVTQSLAILAGTQEGLAVSPDTGCSWAFAPNIGPWATDVALRRDQPGSALALARTVVATPIDGGATVSPALFLTSDDGATWAPYGTALGEFFWPTTVDVAPSDHRRTYLGGIHVTAGIPQAVLVASADDGMTWNETPVPDFNPYAEIDALVGGVDPVNPDRVYLRIQRAVGSRLLVSDDGGKTLRTVMTTDVPMPGFAISPDGSKVYLGGDDGVHVASASTLSFTTVSNIPVDCLAASASTLYACSLDLHGFTLAASHDDGATFTPLLHLCDVRGPLACPGSASVVCADEWLDVRGTLPFTAADGGCISPPSDAGAEASAADASPDGDATVGDAADAAAGREPSDAATPPVTPSSKCACTAAGDSSGALPSALGSCLACALLLRRQGRRPARKQTRDTMFE